MRREASAERVAFRFLVAGGSDFVDFGTGTDPKKAFARLVEDDLAENGHREGYSGTIGAKAGYGFVLRGQPMSRHEAEQFANRDLDNNRKFGPAFAVPVLGDKPETTKKMKVEVRADSEEEARIAFGIWAKSQDKNATSEVRSLRDLEKKDSRGFQLWEVRGTISVPGPVIGFLFYGIASS